MNRLAKYATAIVGAHLLVTMAHGLAHQELHIGLTPFEAAFVLIVVGIAPIMAAGLVWTRGRRAALLLLSASMLASALFGLYHHFIVPGADHVHAQPATAWGTTFIYSSYGLLVTELIGACVGIPFLLSRNARSQ